jgi:hypothetical protein
MHNLLNHARQVRACKKNHIEELYKNSIHLEETLDPQE